LIRNSSAREFNHCIS